MSRRIVPLGMDDALAFGKHKDKFIWEVIEKDPGWLKWAIANIKDFEIDNEAYEALSKKRA